MNIKRFRNLANKKVEEVAKDLDIGIDSYKSYEINRRKPPIDTLIKLADYFNVSLDRLVGRDFVDDASVNELFNKLTDENREETIKYIKLLLKSQEK